ncbi:hypothetical protein Q3G72_016010 [Acer saccharum]|nr:hypothetical protein Q3G72_016010 [Acer saccharum]
MYSKSIAGGAADIYSKSIADAGDQDSTPSSKNFADEKVLQANIDYDGSRVDCGPIQPGGSCFLPDTLKSHASFAMNSFFQSNFGISNKMKVIEEEQKEIPMEERLTEKEICQQELGKRSGYVKRLGYGPKPTTMHSKGITTETRRLENIVATQEVEIEEHKKEIEEHKKKIEEQEKEVGDMKVRISQFEDIMRLFMSQSRSSQETFFQPI